MARHRPWRGQAGLRFRHDVPRGAMARWQITLASEGRFGQTLAALFERSRRGLWPVRLIRYVDDAIQNCVGINGIANERMQFVHGIWLVTIVDWRPQRSSRISRILVLCTVPPRRRGNKSAKCCGRQEGGADDRGKKAKWPLTCFEAKLGREAGRILFASMVLNPSSDLEAQITPR